MMRKCLVLVTIVCVVAGMAAGLKDEEEPVKRTATPYPKKGAVPARGSAPILGGLGPRGHGQGQLAARKAQTTIAQKRSKLASIAEDDSGCDERRRTPTAPASTTPKRVPRRASSPALPAIAAAPSPARAFSAPTPAAAAAATPVSSPEELAMAQAAAAAKRVQAESDEAQRRANRSVGSLIEKSRKELRAQETAKREMDTAVVLSKQITSDEQEQAQLVQEVASKHARRSMEKSLGMSLGQYRGHVQALLYSMVFVAGVFSLVSGLAQGLEACTNLRESVKIALGRDDQQYGQYFERLDNYVCMTSKFPAMATPPTDVVVRDAYDNAMHGTLATQYQSSKNLLWFGVIATAIVPILAQSPMFFTVA